MLTKIKAAFKGICWPSKKSIFVDTTFSLLTATALSILIMLWSMGIEKVINLFF